MRLHEKAVVTSVEDLTLRQLRSWVRKGWIRPVQERRSVVFSDIDVARIRLVCHLKRELNANDDTVTVVLSLLDQMYGLRRELRTLGEAIERQPATVQRQISELVRSLARK